ncbi:MAG: Rrf2 family transcriptional regulator [Bacteroidetes bacterium]|nr:MAG: Rrf2 family transcriptional regulator [Bacteroidota bacterium]
MFQLSKRVEYGLIALSHMAKGQLGQIYTAKEVSERYNLPYDLLAKVMQKLAKRGFISSYQGVRGGYTLVKHPVTLTIASVVDAIEDRPSFAIMQCESHPADSCTIHKQCTIKDPLLKLQGSINKVMEEMTIMELV